MIPRLGIKLCGMYFFYCSLVMGLAPSCRVYTEFADVVMWAVIHSNSAIFQQTVAQRIYDLLKHVCTVRLIMSVNNLSSHQ